jgi:hypothetical protein
MSDVLEALETEIADLGGQIRALKAEGPSAPAGQVSDLVARLLEKKRAYAELNGGVGVDGKPLGASGGGGDGGGGKKKDKEKGPAKQVSKERTSHLRCGLARYGIFANRLSLSLLGPVKLTRPFQTAAWLT